MPPRLNPETLRLYAIFGPQDLAKGWSAAGLAEAVLRGGRPACNGGTRPRWPARLWPNG